MTEVLEMAMTDQQWSMGQDWSEPPAAGSMATPLVGHRFRAVQEDIAVTVVDWPVVHACIGTRTMPCPGNRTDRVRNTETETQ
jgi:hypothetical protein